MEIYQLSILVEYCDFMTGISTVSHGILFCWLCGCTKTTLGRLVIHGNA